MTGGMEMGGGKGADPLEMIQNCLNDLNALMSALPDAEGTAMAHQAMAPLLKLQAKYHKAFDQQSGSQQLLSQLGGGQ
jgi:hypothetical protein